MLTGLSGTRRLFEEREPLYRAAADYMISSAGTPEETVQRIRRAFHLKEAIC